MVRTGGDLVERFVHYEVANGDSEFYGGTNVLVFEPGVKSQSFTIAAKQDNIPEVTGRVAQSLKCLATDACLTANPGVASSIPARSHTFMEIDHEIISTVILLPSTESFKKDCCQLQSKVCARSTD